MDRPIVDGRWRVHINGEGGMMVSVDLIAMVTSEASEGYERRLRAKRVMVTSEGYERSELWLRAKRVMVVFNDTPMEEGSGVFFLTLLTSSSLCPHSYGGRFWSVLPHTAHFVIPVISLLWRKVLECSSSHCSLRHPCVLTHFVIPVFSLTSSSLCSHTHDLSSHPSRYP